MDEELNTVQPGSPKGVAISTALHRMFLAREAVERNMAPVPDGFLAMESSVPPGRWDPEYTVREFQEVYAEHGVAFPVSGDDLARERWVG